MAAQRPPSIGASENAPFVSRPQGPYDHKMRAQHCDVTRYAKHQSHEFEGLRDESAHLGACSTNYLAHLGRKCRDEFCELSFSFSRWHSIRPTRWVRR